jgi:general secretion pathway protein B
MSFILDALRKSEHERQRQTGPALVETVVAAPKVRSNPWATAAIALLVVNLVAIGVLLLMRSSGEQAAAPAAPAASAVPPPATVAPQAPPTGTNAPAAPSSAPPPAVAAAPPAARPPPMLSPAVSPSVPGRNPLESEVVDESAPPANEALAQAALPPPGPPAVVQSPRQRGTVVYQSMPETDPVGPVSRPPPQRDLPTADELTARGGMPELRLELHVYSNKPSERIVFVNGHRYGEGDTTQEGAVVQEITRDGVVMSLRGNRFLLPRE